jgi:hypothetical protein
MAWKRRAGKEEREPLLGIGNVSHHTIDPGVGARNKGSCDKPTRGSSKTHWPWTLYGAIRLIAFIWDGLVSRVAEMAICDLAKLDHGVWCARACSDAAALSFCGRPRNDSRHPPERTSDNRGRNHR